MLRRIAASLAMAWLVAVCLAAACLGPRPALAIEVGSPACKRELQDMRKKMQESLAVIDGVKEAPATAKCRAYSVASNIADQIRESAARCEEPKARTSAVRDADDVVDAIDKTYRKWCPPRPGMVRVKMTMVSRITRNQLPKPLAAVHTCVESGTMHSSNERFDLGRLIVLGCPGNPNPTPEQAKARNATYEILRGEQAHIYLARDRDGDDPRLLRFPILTADGAEGVTDMVAASRVFVGDKLDLISSYWEPAKAHVCRVHAIWRVSDAKARLVLWEEATDCSKGDKTEFTPVLDRR